MRAVLIRSWLYVAIYLSFLYVSDCLLSILPCFPLIFSYGFREESGMSDTVYGASMAIVIDLMRRARRPFGIKVAQSSNSDAATAVVGSSPMIQSRL